MNLRVHHTSQRVKLGLKYVAVLGAAIIGACACGWSRAAAGAGQAAPAAQSIRTFRAYDFVDSVGVNTHLLHPDSFYGAQQFAVMKQRLLDAHIRHIRDGAMDQRGDFFQGDQAARYQELGNAGIRVTFIFRVPPLSQQFVQGFPDRVKPAFEAYELPNELNLNMSEWVPTLQSWLPEFRRLIKSGTTSASYPIIGPSLADLGNDPYRSLGNQAAHFDFGNLHKYYSNHSPGTTGYGAAGKPPCEAFRYGSLDYELCHLAKVSDAKAVICTEAGYGSDAAAGGQVTPEVQAKYIARMLMLHLKAGIRRTFIYQLADYGDNAFGSYGLLTAQGAEKPAFRELRILMSELNDTPGAPAPASAAVTLSGDTADVESLLFAMSNRSYRLVIWIEKPGYDTAANGGKGQAVAVPARTVRVNLAKAGQARRQMVFTDTGAAEVRTLDTPASFRVPVGDNLTIVDFTGEARRAPAPPGSVRIER